MAGHRSSWKPSRDDQDRTARESLDSPTQRVVGGHSPCSHPPRGNDRRGIPRPALSEPTPFARPETSMGEEVPRSQTQHGAREKPKLRLGPHVGTYIVWVTNITAPVFLSSWIMAPPPKPFPLKVPTTVQTPPFRPVCQGFSASILALP